MKTIDFNAPVYSVSTSYKGTDTYICVDKLGVYERTYNDNRKTTDVDAIKKAKYFEPRKSKTLFMTKKSRNHLNELGIENYFTDKLYPTQKCVEIEFSPRLRNIILDKDYEKFNEECDRNIGLNGDTVCKNKLWNLFNTHNHIKNWEDGTKHVVLFVDNEHPIHLPFPVKWKNKSFTSTNFVLGDYYKNRLEIDSATGKTVVRMNY